MRALLLIVVLVPACHARASGRQSAPIGSACAGDASCGTGRFACAVDHPGGYCVAACRDDDACPAGSVCVGGDAVSTGACHVRCQGAADCRTSEGYVCSAAGRDASHDYCDVPGPRSVLRRLRALFWR